MTTDTTGTPANETTFSIRFSETDMAGVVHHRNMFVWFEVGRFHLLGNIMGDHKMLSATNAPIFMPVVKTRVAFKGFGRFGDELRLETFLKRAESTKLTFYYHLTKIQDSKTVAIGMTEHVALTADHRFLFKWPEHIAERLEQFSLRHSYAFTDGEAFDAKL
jgi:acyl-CoA thioester hydrolase